MKYLATRQGDLTVAGRTRALFEGQVYEFDEGDVGDADWLVAQPPSGGESAGAEAPEVAGEAPKPPRRRRARRKADGE